MFVGLGKVGPYRGASALRDLIAQFRLRDAWVTMHGDTFAATWSRSRSASRIDKFLFPTELSGILTSCEVLRFPEDAPRISDHAPLSVTLESEADGPRPDLWRMDQCLLTDPVSAEEIRQSLRAEGDSSAEAIDWDTRKKGWRTLLIKAGRDRKVRVTRELNEVFRRMRIVHMLTRSPSLCGSTWTCLGGVTSGYCANPPVQLAGRQSWAGG